MPGLHPVGYDYDERGRLSSVSVGSRVSSLGYDQYGYPDTMTTPDGRVVDYDYDIMGRLRGVTYPGGVSLAYSYDAGGGLTVLTGPPREN